MDLSKVRAELLAVESAYNAEITAYKKQITDSQAQVLTLQAQIAALQAQITVPTQPVFQDDFSIDAPIGTFLAKYPNWSAYPYGYTDTSRNSRSNPGYYYPEKTLSVANGVLSAWMHYDSALGKYLVAAPKPRHPAMTYGKFSMRMRADKIPGYKVAILLWPDDDAIAWPSGGEIDFPEGDLDGTPFHAYHHYALASGGQDSFSSLADPTMWHVYDVVWSQGKVEFFVDGVSIGSSTKYVPSKPMHWVLQCETQISATAPPITAQGNVQFDWVKVYK